MPRYLVRARVTTAFIARLSANPTDRTEVLGRLIEDAGGKLLGWYFSPEDCMVSEIVDVPEASTLDAVNLAVIAGGTVDPSTVAVSRVLTGAELADTLRAAAAVSYTPPT